MKLSLLLALLLAGIVWSSAQTTESPGSNDPAKAAAVARLKLLISTPVMDGAAADSPDSLVNAADAGRQAASLYASNLAVYQQQIAALGPITLERNKKQIEYDIFNYTYHEELFNWQHTSTVIIFWVVILIVLAGITFSGVQFYIAMLHEKQEVRRVTGGAGQPGAGPPDGSEGNSLAGPTELEVSLSGLKVKSQILGVVILALSIVFFYLYLSIVYPIKTVPEPSAPAAAAAGLSRTP